MADKKKFICPIFNLEIVNEKEHPNVLISGEINKFEPLNFVGGSVLKPMPKEELLYREGFEKIFLSHIPAKFINPYDYVPAIEVLEEDDKIVSYLENVEAALRIYKEGDVFCKPVWSEDGHPMLLAQAYEVPSTIFSRAYELKKQEIGEINEIFEKLQKIDFKKEANLRVAITRLNTSYGKSMPSDKIVDFMIAFEALFVKGTTNNGTIIATGASFLLGKNQSERITIYNDLLHSYDIRNKIVHGNPETPKEIAKSADQLINYLRKAILLLIS